MNSRRRGGIAGLAWALTALIVGCGPQTAGPPVDQTAGAAARKAAEATARIDRQTAETHMQLAKALEAAGDYSAALVDYTAALGYDAWPAEADAAPGTGTPYAGLARLCTGDEPGRVPDEVVVRACAGAVNIGRFPPDRLAEFLVDRGEANRRLGRYKRAMADYRSAQTLDSSNPRVNVAIGRLNEEMGDDRAALRAYGLELLRRPGSAPARLARGRLLARQGDLKGAIADFDVILSNAATIASTPRAYRARARAECRLGQPEKAAVDWQTWILLDPLGPDYARDMLASRGYLRGSGTGFGPAARHALEAWVRDGCPGG